MTSMPLLPNTLTHFSTEVLVKLRMLRGRCYILKWAGPSPGGTEPIIQTKKQDGRGAKTVFGVDRNKILWHYYLLMPDFTGLSLKSEQGTAACLLPRSICSGEEGPLLRPGSPR